jgi:hypothetical protein
VGGDGVTSCGIVSEVFRRDARGVDRTAVVGVMWVSGWVIGALFSFFFRLFVELECMSIS